MESPHFIPQKGEDIVELQQSMVQIQEDQYKWLMMFKLQAWGKI